MKKNLPLALSAVVAAVASAAPVDEVNVFIGTDGIGHTTPAAWHPAGLVQPGPDSGYADWRHCSGYCRDDVSICGFSATKDTPGLCLTLGIP